MPDDCGEIEEHYMNALRNLQANTFAQRADTFLKHIPSFSRVCKYCRTDPVKHICVNCGAPQERN